ncbi:hypothetical protein ABES02_29055 [Neobacillus pocheonensis]|uniref:hypothetical protein n=1 Tax=Neobacillus pocheonensis TaxID=363869 RepID=UPI003D2BDC92
MQYTFTVKRNRQSVTQGSVTVYLNDIEILTFGDTIELIQEGQQHHGEMIGKWASVKPDEDFIKGVLFHPYDEYYKYSDKVKKVLISKNSKRFEEANGIIFTVNEMTDEIKEYFDGRGIEFHELINGIYYTETVMSMTEFKQLENIIQIKHIA